MLFLLDIDNVSFEKLNLFDWNHLTAFGQLLDRWKLRTMMMMVQMVRLQMMMMQMMQTTFYLVPLPANVNQHSSFASNF